MWKQQTAAVLVICSAMLGACGDDHGKKRVRTTADDGEDTPRRAAREAEAKLMSDPVAGAAALEQRIGEWLEVRSKQGNPPGFVRRDDVIMISRAN